MTILSRPFMIMVLTYLTAIAPQTVNHKQTSAQEGIDLTGDWVEITKGICKGGDERRLIRIDQKGDEISMTNMTDDACNKKGVWLMKGSFTQNPFRVIYNAYKINAPNVKTTFDGIAEVINNNSIKILITTAHRKRDRIVIPLRFMHRVNVCDDSSIQAAYDPSHLTYHKYTIKNRICSVSNTNCTREKVFSTMLKEARFIAPTNDRSPVSECKTTLVNVTPLSDNNPVKSVINKAALSVTNYTTEKHLLHPGQVTRKVIEESGGVYILTTGEGTGVGPGLNITFSGPVWDKVDEILKNELSIKGIR